MKLNYYLPYILLIPVLLIQITIIPFFAFTDIVPDLIIILLVFYTLVNGQIYGTITGFIFGLAVDLFTGGVLGSSMFSKTIAGFTAGYFYNENKISGNISSLVFSVIVFISAFFDSLLFGFFGNTGENVPGILLLVFEQGILPALYTSIVSTSVVILNLGKNYNE